MTYAQSFERRRMDDSKVSVADECRHAALDFMAGVADGWAKLDLALWLRGTYALACRHSPRGERAPVSGVHKRPAIEEPTIESLLVTTRGHILAALELAALVGGTPDFIEDAIIEGHVRRAIDVHGESTWVPVDFSRMRLKDRIASLFVADYLNRPSDYQHLHVCHLCESVTFEPEAKDRGRCDKHRVSSMNLKSGSAPCGRTRLNHRPRAVVKVV
jgi:hypothetical protein